MAVSLVKNAFLFLFLTFIATAYGNQCTKPHVRREWRTLSKAERADWVAAVNCLAKVPHKPALTPTFNTTVTQIPPVNSNSSYWDDFVYSHMDLNPAIHNTGFFLPWHRAYINDLENAMKTECNYKGTLPYWDWTKDASANFPNATIFSDTSAETGLGGWGDPNNDYQLTDGGFSNFQLAYPAPHRLRRQYSARFPNITDPFGDGTPVPTDDLWTYFTPASRDALVNGFVADFPGFQGLFESLSGSHGSVHLIFGGDMGGTCPWGLGAPECIGGAKWSANEPMFMLHHAMVDKIWYDWQRAHPENFWAFLGGSVGAHSEPGLYAKFPSGAPPFLNFASPIPTDGILRNYTIFELMDPTKYKLCYTYQ